MNTDKHLNAIGAVLLTLPIQNNLNEAFLIYVGVNMELHEAKIRRGEADSLLPFFIEALKAFFMNLKTLEEVLEERVIDVATSQSCGAGDYMKQAKASAAQLTGMSVKQAASEPDTLIAGAMEDHSLASIHLDDTRKQVDKLEVWIKKLHGLRGETVPIELVQRFRNI